MVRLGRSGPVVALVVVAALAAACGSSGSSTASGKSSGAGGSSGSSTTADVNKSTFCADNLKIDKASSSASSAQDFVAVLKQNQSVLADMSAHLPSGSLGTEAQQLLAAANQAIQSNDASGLQSPSLGKIGGDLDTYCGTDGNGNPLPAYFGQGKGSAFCTTDTQISTGTSATSDANGVLAFLKGHQSLVSDFGSQLSSLPANLKTEAQTLFNSAQQAISSNNANPLGSPDVTKAAGDIDLYCGINH